MDGIEIDEDFVKISYQEGSEFMEFPIEEDGTLLLSTLQAQFPAGIGLKYRSSSGAWRAIREANSVLHPPKIGWGQRVYCLTISDSSKGDFAGSLGSGLREDKVPAVNHLLQDLAVMGLPYKTTDQELKEYFEMNYGELAFYEIKMDHSTGKSRGFGFIRFKDENAAKEAVSTEHYFDGRKVEVRMKKDKPMKLFVGRLPHGSTLDDLTKYFSRYGEIADAYIPTPFRNFAFITYASTESAKACMQDTHVLGGSRLNVMERNPKDKDKLTKDGSLHDMGSTSNSYSGFAYEPKDVQQSFMDYSSSREKYNDDDLKKMLFQFINNQK